MLFSKKPNSESPDNEPKKSARGAERRRHPRIQKNYILSYFDKRKPTEKIEISQLKNISKGGMCFITSSRFDKGTVLGIELKTPFISETTYLEGHVVESHEKAKNMLYETRLQFEFVNEHANFLLDKLIEFFEKEEKK